MSSATRMSQTLLWPKYRTTASGRVQTITPSPAVAQYAAFEEVRGGLVHLDRVKCRHVAADRTSRPESPCEPGRGRPPRSDGSAARAHAVHRSCPPRCHRLTPRIGMDDYANRDRPQARLGALLAEEGVAVDDPGTNPWRRSSRPLVIAHRGQSAEVPENTLDVVRSGDRSRRRGDRSRCADESRRSPRR